MTQKTGCECCCRGCKKTSRFINLLCQHSTPATRVSNSGFRTLLLVPSKEHKKESQQRFLKRRQQHRSTNQQTSFSWVMACKLAEPHLLWMMLSRKSLKNSIRFASVSRAGQSLSDTWAWWHLCQDALQTVSHENIWIVMLKCLALVSRVVCLFFASSSSVRSFPFAFRSTPWTP